MALNLDPITGLPSDFLAPDLYQIPLNSRPQLAPEWSPDHLPPNALHPDNMPSMFATVQAQNSLNPELPQACTTDGAGNLNVNVRAGGGGGGGGVAPAKMRTVGFDAFMSDHAGLHIFNNAVALGAVLYGFVVQYAIMGGPIGAPEGSTMSLSIEDGSTGTRFLLTPLTLNNTPAGAVPGIIMPVFFPVPMDLTIDGGQAGDVYDLYVNAQNNIPVNFSVVFYTSS